MFFILILVAGFMVYQYATGDHPKIEGTSQSSAALIPATSRVRLESGLFQRLAESSRGMVRASEELRQGETLGHVLDRLGMDKVQAHEVAAAAGEAMDLTRIRPGLRVTAYREGQSGPPDRLEFTSGAEPPVILIQTPAGYAVSRHEYESIITLEAAHGRISSSLWNAAVGELGLNPELVMSLADIFAYDVDFFTDIRENDSFSLLYQNRFCQGACLGPGRILAASFVNEGRKFEAFYFENSKGEGGYYNAEGRSLRKMFLKSPLQYRRISSFFSRSRLHPILKIRRPHLGVDYAAPSGTPVESLGDGKVIFKGRKGGYGNYIEIRHGMGYVTCYGHLSGFAKGLKNGQHVQQGQLIGYVGATGLATGPHLDFRIKRNNEFIDPLALKLEPAPPIPSGEKGRFMAEADRLRGELSRIVASR